MPNPHPNRAIQAMWERHAQALQQLAPTIGEPQLSAFIRSIAPTRPRPSPAKPPPAQPPPTPPPPTAKKNQPVRAPT